MRYLSVFILLFFTTSIYAQRLSHPHKVIQLSQDGAVNPNEISVGINPTNKDNIVAVSMQFTYPNGSRGTTNYAYWTMDGGKSVNIIGNPNPERRTQGDDAIVFDANGHAYHSYISFNGIRQSRPNLARNGIFVTKSTDGGKNWGDPVPVIDHINTVEPFEDKPWLVTDNTNSEHSGNLYVSWTQFDVYGSTSPTDSTYILFSRSTDGGNSFSPALRISDKGGNAVDDDFTVEGAVPAVGPNGEVYVAWAGPRGIEFDKSLDGGYSFGKDTVITEQVNGWDMEIPGIGRANGMPVTQVDLSDSENMGTIYVNWIDDRNGDFDVFLIHSIDGGKSWSEPLRVNNDMLGNGADQFFTWMSVDPIDGSVNIAFYDRRDLSGTETALTLARSTDGGRSFTNYSIEQPVFETQSRFFFGDYIGISAYDSRVVVAYQHFLNETEMAVSAAIFDY